VEPYGDLIGSQTPRIFTGPLGELTPETSDGFACVDWMRDNGFDPLPWQEALTWAIFERHPERPDRRRWRTAVVVLPRQNGKSQWATAVQAYRCATGDAEVAVTAAQSRNIACEMMLRGARILDVTTRQNAVGRRYAGSGFERIELNNGARWLVETMSPEAGRGLSVDHLHLDELRHAKSEADGFAALEPTTTARPRGLVLVTSNAGTRDSVVLNGLIARGRQAAELDEYTGSLGLWEWSAPSDAALDDREAWRIANPSLGRTLDPEVLENALATSSPNTFRTERLSILVTTDSAAIDAAAWDDCGDPSGNLDFARSRIALAVDSSPSGHTSLCAAGVDRTGVVRVEVVAAWSSPAEAREELPALIERIKPRKVGYFSASPTSALAQELRDAAGDRLVKLSDPGEACAAFASLISGRRLRHGSQGLLDEHVNGASRMPRGQGWVFARREVSQAVDGAYSAAGAVLLARQLPPPSSSRLVVAA
jgi:hypothetical protein